jgi:hypothetical protein
MFLPLAIVLLLAVAWTGYWFLASGVARERLAAERVKLAARGFTLTCLEEGWGGYPFHFELSCSSPVATAPGRAELRSARLLLVALAYAPWQVAALIDGPTTISAPGVMTIELTHQRALAAATFDKNWQASLSMEVPALTAGKLGKSEKLLLFTRPSPSGGTEVALEATHVTYTPEGKPPVNIDSGTLQGTLQTDQTFKLDKFELSQGTLRYWGAGTLALDSQHRIAGQIDTQTNDSQALLAIAAPQLGLSDGKLANLRTVLGLLGNGAKAPIIARDGALYLGPFQVADLQPLY